MRAIVFIAVLIAAACAQAERPAWDAYLEEGERLGAPLAGATLSAEGLGPLRIGMSIEEVNALLGAELESVAAEESCGEWSVVQSQGAAIALMTHNGRVTRITTYGDLGLRTPEGITIGSPVAAVNAAYPNAQRVAAEYYDEPAHDLYAWTDTEAWIGLHFRIDEQERVAEMDAGGELKNIEGCAPQL